MLCETSRRLRPATFPGLSTKRAARSRSTFRRHKLAGGSAAYWAPCFESRMVYSSVGSIVLTMKTLPINANHRQESSMSAKRGRHHDLSAALPLPINGLLADLELGIGGLSLPDDFFRTSSAIQIEIISDWQRALNEKRLEALARLYNDLFR